MRSAAINIKVALFAVLALMGSSELGAQWHRDYERGLKALREGQFQVAARHLERAIDVSPTPGSRVQTVGMVFIDYYPYFHLGKAYFHLGAGYRAREMFERSEALSELATEPELAQELARFMGEIKIDTTTTITTTSVAVRRCPSLVPTRGVVITEDCQQVRVFSRSYALLIGNGRYQHWNPLEWPARDVDQIAGELRRLGFETRVHTDLTFQAYSDVIGRFLAREGRDADAQLLFYYAGHGHTEKGAGGRSLGYVVMTDAPHPGANLAGFMSRSISMESFLTYARQIVARHALFVFDSCFSGSVLNVRSTPMPEAIRESIALPTREFLTAGSAEETVPDLSVFRAVLLDVLGGRIPEPIPDGYLTGEELALVMRNEVPAYGWHPQFGKILDPGFRGDFVFFLPPRLLTQRR